MATQSRPPLAIFALLIIGALTHLIGLSHPRQVVFDEVHWGKFVSAYCCTGQRVFDVHPPIGKLALTAGAWLGGYDGTQSFESIGLPYGQTPVFWLRLIPALSGIAIPVLFFLLLRALGGSVAIAWLGGFLLALDNAFILQTRTMLFDGVLVAASLASLVCVLWSDRATTRRGRWACTLACGAFAGLAVGTKFTGLAVPALIAAWLARAWWTERRGLAHLTRGLVIAVMAAAVYLAGWMVHFSLLTQPGPGDAFHPTTGRFIEDLRVTHRTMIAANAGLTATHPDASHPLSWPIMKVPPFFWSSDTGAVEYLAGNPVVWWGSTVMLVSIVTISALRRTQAQQHVSTPAQQHVSTPARQHISTPAQQHASTPARQPISTPARQHISTPAQQHVSTPAQQHISTSAQRSWWLLLAYAVAYLPFFGVSRILFLYHYLTPLVFALGFVLLWLEEAGWTRRDDVQGQRASYYGVMVAGVAGFVLMSPLTYGFTAGAYSEWLVAVIRSWR